jgi:hypothetical protein
LRYCSALAWARYAWFGDTTPTASVTSSGGDGNLTPPKQEDELRARAEQYLNPQAAAKNPVTGVDACMELGFFYLRNNKLDDAENLFVRLENLKLVEQNQYHFLGHLGHAIVLALNNHAKESNDLFSQAFKPPRDFVRPGLGGKTGRDKGLPHDLPHDGHTQVLDNKQMQYWLAEAIHYNEKNGIPHRELPAALMPYADPTTPK